jgi:hypothetical protein
MRIVEVPKSVVACLGGLVGHHVATVEDETNGFCKRGTMKTLGVESPQWNTPKLLSAPPCQSGRDF